MYIWYTDDIPLIFCAISMIQSFIGNDILLCSTPNIYQCSVTLSHHKSLEATLFDNIIIPSIQEFRWIAKFRCNQPAKKCFFLMGRASPARSWLPVWLDKTGICVPFFRRFLREVKREPTMRVQVSDQYPLLQVRFWMFDVSHLGSFNHRLTLNPFTVHKN